MLSEGGGAVVIPRRRKVVPAQALDVIGVRGVPPRQCPFGLTQNDECRCLTSDRRAEVAANAVFG